MLPDYLCDGDLFRVDVGFLARLELPLVARLFLRVAARTIQYARFQSSALWSLMRLVDSSGSPLFGRSIPGPNRSAKKHCGAARMTWCMLHTHDR